MSVLPARNSVAEEEFIESLRHSDPVHLLDLVEAAVRERRLALAGRLVQLIEPELVKNEPGSAVSRALQAARLLLHERTTPEERSWCAWDAALAEIRDAWMERARFRGRQVVRPEAGDMLGFTQGRPRKPRR
jgi:hypothetical protein